jgi:hypothetical protein
MLSGPKNLLLTAMRKPRDWESEKTERTIGKSTDRGYNPDPPQGHFMR